MKNEICVGDTVLCVDSYGTDNLETGSRYRVTGVTKQNISGETMLELNGGSKIFYARRFVKVDAKSPFQRWEEKMGT